MSESEEARCDVQDLTPERFARNVGELVRIRWYCIGMEPLRVGGVREFSSDAADRGWDSGASRRVWPFSRRGARGVWALSNSTCVREQGPLVHERKKSNIEGYAGRK